MARIVLDRAGIAVLLRGPNGDVTKYIKRRTRAVERRARRGAPKDSLALASSVYSEFARLGGVMVGRVSARAAHAPFVIFGTGVYGPRGARIRPRRARALRFTVGGRTVHAASVRGQRPNDFLEDALRAV